MYVALNTFRACFFLKSKLPLPKPGCRKRRRICWCGVVLTLNCNRQGTVKRLSIGGRSLKRAFPHKVKSAANSKLQNQVLPEISKQGQGNNNLACCPAAMIGLAAISTMGVPSILLSGGGDRAIAAEPPSIDVSQIQEEGEQLARQQVDVSSGVKTPKGLLLEKLTKEYVEDASDADHLNTLDGLLLVGQKPENPSFNGTLQPELKVPNTRATIPYQQQYVVSKLEAMVAKSPSQLKTEAKPQKFLLEESEAIGFHKQLKNEAALTTEAQNPTLTDIVGTSLSSYKEKSLAEWRYEESESSSNSLGSNAWKSSPKTLAEQVVNGQGSETIINASQSVKPVEVEPELFEANTRTEEISWLKSQKTNEISTQVEGAVVIDSERIEAPLAKVYEVRSGDTLAVIARSHGVSVEELVALNNLIDPNLIEVSQTLKIPHKQSHLSGKEGIDSVSTDSIQVDSSAQNLSPNESYYYGFTLPKAKLQPIAPVSNSIPSQTSLGQIELVSWTKQGGDRSTPEVEPKEKELTRSIMPNGDSANNSRLFSLNVTDAQGSDLVSVIGPENTGDNNLNNNPATARQTLDRDYNEDYSEVSQNSSSNNSYSQRLRSEILRMRQQYEFEMESQPSTNNWNSEAAGDNNPHTAQERDIQVPQFNLNGSSQLRQPEINSPQNTEVFENMSPRRQEIYQPELLRREELRVPEEPSLVGAKSEKAQEILNSSLGQMVSPDLPPLEGADTYLPGGSMQFTGYIWPAQGTLTSGYGWRWGRMHDGIDIAAPTGTPIMAAAPGVVTFAGWNSGYGYLVEIQHPDESLTLYAHNSQILVQEGQTVAQGELISKMGSTGRSTGPHLHFEIHPTGHGAVNPIAYLPSTQASR